MGGASVGFVDDLRFRPGGGPAAAEATLHDRAELDEAFAEGRRAGFAEAQGVQADDDAARTGLTMALARLDEGLGEQLATRLAAVVAALCEATMAPFAIDPDALQRRCIAAAGLVGEGMLDATLRLNPADIALLDRGFASTWHLLPDASLERGTLVFDTDAGAIEDGPGQWRAALAEALGVDPHLMSSGAC